MGRGNPIVHPILFAVFPVFFLYARNMGQFDLAVTVVPSAKAAGVAAAIWIVAGLAMRSARKGAIIASLIVLPYFSFNSVAAVLRRFTSGGAGIGIEVRHPVAAVLIAAAALGVYAVARTKKDLVKITSIFNFSAICLVALPVMSIAAYEFRKAGREREAPRGADGAAALGVPASTPRPSVFYIILDGYGRSDMLEEVYGYDNSAFVNYLRGKGFYVAEGARANYSHTRFSLASSLNMQYLDDLAKRVGADYTDNDAVEKMIKDSTVRRVFAALGYRTVAFATGFYGTDIENADTFLRAPLGRDEFERGVSDAMTPKTDEEKAAYDRRRILFTLEKLPGLAATKMPVFVFAHIVAPHPPYVFNRDGGPADIDRYYDGLVSANHLVNSEGITRSKSMQLYIDQLIFLDSRLTGVLDKILANSQGKAIVILQGDHGPCCFTHHEELSKTYLKDRMAILAALHLPGEVQKGLYETVTPVNSFRIIFKGCFGLGYPPLADRSFYSSVLAPYKFVDVTDEIGSEADQKRYEYLKGQDYYGESE